MSGLSSTIRQFGDRYLWTHPSILATFRCRPTYHAAFKNAWLYLMWGGETRLREAVAVAVSAANSCVY